MKATQFMPELADNKDRTMMMQESALKIEETDYRIPLTPEELDQKREQHMNNCIWLKEKADDFAVVKDEYKDLIKPKATENALLLDEVVSRQQKKSGILYHMPDHETGIVTVYDQNGEFVSSRRMTPEEKAKHTLPFTIKKAS